jgi:hypothetical protein
MATARWPGPERHELARYLWDTVETLGSVVGTLEGARVKAADQSWSSTTTGAPLLLTTVAALPALISDREPRSI